MCLTQGGLEVYINYHQGTSTDTKHTDTVQSTHSTLPAVRARAMHRLGWQDQGGRGQDCNSALKSNIYIQREKKI